MKNKGNEEAISLCLNVIKSYFYKGRITNPKWMRIFGRLLPLQKTIANTKTNVKVDRASRHK